MPIIRVAMLALALGLGVDTAWAQGFGSAAPERFFRVEATGGQGRGGRPIVSGYIYNDYGNAAGRIQLALESLDASGQVVGRSLVHVDGIITPYSRIYFEVPAGTPGATYRARIHYFEWIRGGGAGASLPWPGHTS